MAKFVRCPSGHVYDSQTNDVCPRCGAVANPATKPVIGEIPVPASQAETASAVASAPSQVPTVKPWMLGASGAAVVALVVGVVFLSTRPTPIPDPKPVQSAAMADPLADTDYNACVTRSGGIAACDRAIASKTFSGPVLANAYIWRSVGKQSVLKLDEALADALEGVRLDPQNAEPLNSAGIISNLMGKTDEALSLYDRALKINPYNAGALAEKGQIHAIRKEFDLALADLDRSIAINPEQIWGYKYRGDVLRQKGDIEKARSDYQQGLAHTDVESSKKIFSNALASLGPPANAAPVPVLAAPPPAAAASKSDPLWQACAKAKGGDIEVACNAAMSSGKFTGPVLADLYTQRGAGKAPTDREGAIADFSEAIKIDPKNAVALGDRGELYRRNGDFERALPDLDAAVAQSDKPAFVLLGRGRLYVAKADYDKAIADLNRVVELTPNDPLAFNARADAFQRKGYHDGALTDYKKALTLNPSAKLKSDIETAIAALSSPTTLARTTTPTPTPTPTPPKQAAVQASNATSDDPLFKACKSEGLKQIDSCTSAIDSKKFAGPVLSELYNLRGQARGFDFDFEASDDYDKAIAIDPNNADAYYNRAAAILDDDDIKKKDYDKIIADLDKSIQLDPTPYWGWMQRGYAHRAKNENEKALDDFGQAVTISSMPAKTRSTVFAIIEELGKPDPKKNQKQATASPSPAEPKVAPITGDPTPTGPLKIDADYAGCVPKGGTLAACDRAINRKVFKDQQLANLLNARGNFLIKAGRGMEAFGDFQNATKWAPNDPAGYGNSGLFWLNRSSFDKAMPEFETAISLQSDSAYVFAGRGAVFSKRREYDKAMENLDHAIRLDSENAFAYLWRAKAHRDKGEQDLAIADYKSALSFNPSDDVRAEATAALKELGVASQSPAGNPPVKKSETPQGQPTGEASRTAALSAQPKLLPNAGSAPTTAAEAQSDPDYVGCKFPAGTSAACDRAINGKKYKGQELANLYNARGLWFYIEERNAQAFASFEMAVIAAPDDPAGYMNRAEFLLSKNMFEKAVNNYDRAIELKSTEFEVFLGRGKAYTKLKQFDKAVADLSTAISVAPKSGYGYLERAKSYRESGDQEKAAADFKSALSNFLTDDSRKEAVAALKEMGVAYDPPPPPSSPAIKQANVAPQGQSPGNVTPGGVPSDASADSIIAASKALAEQSDFNGALKSISSVIQAQPKLAQAYAVRAKIYFDKSNNDVTLSDLKRSLADWNSAVQLEPDSAVYLVERGRVVSTMSKDRNKAISDYNKALVADPNYTYAYFNRAIMFFEQKKPEQAIADLNIVLSKEPRNALAMLNRGLARAQMKKMDDAIADMAQAIEFDPKYALSYRYRGMAFEEIGRNGAAIDDYKQALALDPKDTYAKKALDRIPDYRTMIAR